MIDVRTFLAVTLLGAVALTARPSPAHAGCNLEYCGGNSPVMAQFWFHELSFVGVPNDQGLMVLGLNHQGALLQPRMIGGKLAAVSGSVVVAQGQALVGDLLIIYDTTMQGPSPTNLYFLEISAVNPPIRHWLHQRGEVIETYDFRWFSDFSPHPTDLCSSVPAVDPEEPEPIHHVNGTILSTGERYDAVRKVVRTDLPTDQWVTFNCPLGWGFKLFMWDLFPDPLPAAPGYPPPPPAPPVAIRTAALKAFAGDFCGTGQSFTKPGVQVRWRDSVGHGNDGPTDFAIESLWDEGGARCLDIHRLGWDYFDEVNAACPKISCGELPKSYLAPFTTRVPADPEAY